MPKQNYFHDPVLLQEVVDFFKPLPGQNFVDATLGAGGYSTALLKAVKPSGKVLSIDLDEEAIKNFNNSLENKYKKNAVIVHGNFAQLDKIVRNQKFNNISGIVADLGFNSAQLDVSGRGLSFQKKEPLDMRLDGKSDEADAKFLLNNESQTNLTKIFRDFGEERYAYQIAARIVKARTSKLFHYTTDLTEIIKDALPKPKQHRWEDSARRIFQALRIAVNHELENLAELLPKALDLVNPGGYVAVVSFHSLEDRIVKQFFSECARGCVCPIDFPQCVCGRNPRGKILTKKPVRAGSEELNRNPRSKPAKLRVLQKIA